jgi:FkbM family methyltransferase
MFNIGDKVHRNVLLPCDHGLMIVNRFDCNENQVGHGQWLLDHGNTTTVEASICLNALKNKSDPVIFDIGANIGTFTTWMAKFYPKGKIYAFEPQRIVFQMLCGNMSINNHDNVYAMNMGLGDENTTIEFFEPDYTQKVDYGTFSLVEKVIDKTTNNLSVVDISTLDSFMSKHKIEKVDLLKIDVEGMDIQVLRGAKETIQRCKPAIFIEHSDNRKSVMQEIEKELDQYKYCYEVHGNNVLATPIFR